MSRRVVLLGGGHAHVHVLQALAREPLAGCELLLVTPYARQLYSGMVPGLVAGHYTEAQCAIALPPLAEAARAPWIEASAVALDAAARRVKLADGRVLDYAWLSIDTGGEMDRDRLPGAREHGLFVRPMELFVQRLPALWALAEQRVLDIVVIGAGAAGVELALALQHRLAPPGASARARVALVTGGPAPAAGYAAGVVRRIAHVLAARGIEVLREACVALEAGAARLTGGVRLACDAAVIATGPEAPRWLAGSGLALGASGHVLTGATLQSRSHPEVFAVGDVAERTDAPHPRSGVYAVRAGPPLALNLRRIVTGGALQAHHPQRRTLNLVSCGERSAVAAWDGWSAEGRWVWRWKDRIDRRFVARYTAPDYSS